MASDGLGKTMVETAEEAAGAGPNYAPVVGARWWEHARLCSLSRENLPAQTGGRLHLYVSRPGSPAGQPAVVAGVVLRHTWLHTQCKRMVTGTGGTVGVCRYAPHQVRQDRRLTDN